MVVALLMALHGIVCILSMGSPAADFPHQPSILAGKPLILAYSSEKPMSRQDNLARVLQSGIVAIIRAPTGERLGDVAEALLAGGIDCMEVTFTIPNAIDILGELNERIGDRVLLGAGTVLDTETARAAILAGAEFIVSPSTRLDVIQLCNRYDKLVMPGALTPTEVITAWEAGADVVKVFPSDLTGPSYLKALHGPLPQVRLMPTGGVNLETAEDFLHAGACALGIGSSLVEKEAVQEGKMERIEELARQYVAIVRQVRDSS